MTFNHVITSYFFKETELIKDLINIERMFKYGKDFDNKIVISYICRIAEQKRPFLFFEIKWI